MSFFTLNDNEKVACKKIGIGVIVRESGEDLKTYQKWINWFMVNFLKVKYNHIELTNNSGFSFSIVEWGKVTKKAKNMSRPGYRFYQIAVTEEQYNAVFDYLERQHQEAKGFAWIPYYFNWTLFPLFCYTHDSKEEKFFCSDLVTRAFIKAKILPDTLTPSKMLPDDVMKELFKSKHKPSLDMNFNKRLRKKKMKPEKRYEYHSDEDDSCVVEINPAVLGVGDDFETESEPDESDPESKPDQGDGFLYPDSSSDEEDKKLK